MTTKLVPNPGNLRNSSPRNSDRQTPHCYLSFRTGKVVFRNKSPPKINLLLFRNNRFPQETRPVRSSAVGDDDKSPPLCSADGRHDSSAVNEEDEAREAVREILREFGASEEDSVDIARQSTKYVAMLIDGVRELDELSLWSSWTGGAKIEHRRSSGGVVVGEEDGASSSSNTPLSLKEKVYYLAKEKGDRGMLPFLESIGMSLPSATHMARYLSSESLPNLIHKVKYVKETFFFDSDNDGRLGKNARRMLMYLSISVDEDVQQTLSFFEKIEARRGGLDILGSRDASFRYLIESFPRILLLSLESRMKPMVEFLKDIGVPRGYMGNILLLFPPIIFFDIEKDIKPRMQAFEKVGADDEDFGRMLLKYPWILSAGIQENYLKILSFFEMEKVPNASVQVAIKSWPLLLGCSISKLKLMLEQFGELGVRNKKLGQVIATSPQLLLRKPQEFLQVVSFLKDLGLDEETVCRIIARCPEIFATSIKNTLKKKLDFLANIGISRSHLPRVIRKYPELFVCDVNRTLLPRIKYLTKTGLSKRDVAFMIRRFSPLLGYSIHEVLRPKLEFLVNTMEKPLKDVVEYPRYFSYSLERKIKPRYWVLKGRNVECSLKDMLGKNNEEFAAEFMGVERILVPPPSLE